MSSSSSLQRTPPTGSAGRNRQRSHRGSEPGGDNASVADRSYTVVAEFVPAHIEADDEDTRKQIEDTNGFDQGDLRAVAWMWPPAKRYAGQRQEMCGAEAFGGTPACLRCQEYRGHTARNCDAPQRCAHCGDSHQVQDCPFGRSREHRFCVPCNSYDHASWDRHCPALHERSGKLFARKTSAQFKYFLTDDPSTWVTHREALSQASPPGTSWDMGNEVLEQIRKAVEGGYRKPSQKERGKIFRQTRLDEVRPTVNLPQSVVDPLTSGKP
ncbi:uncharacterized protein BXZ73DRAFT_83426 [Epithele typhae]|uniref:uncharacterized protein n=1 Tax=Epithele typhae TaxID=378194 RepID=UPI0020075757|nr:uncharacterized protein BXZ73DRAFT_83426 [Epithele typhae]KAH9910554.1 hypothetical protein BXZ73DRAFT_83426 [Epithele typhae]